jgi:DNA polymerase IV
MMLSKKVNLLDRSIFHCDCNGFYASVECLDNPTLKNVPMAVAGDPLDRCGIILAKNELAKRCGVTTAETVWKAHKKCPGLVLVPPRHERYAQVSRQVNAIYESYTDLVEPFGIDESWLDVTGSLHLFRALPEGLADRIRERVKHDIGITISVGVSFCKVFAKLGSDIKKPDATTVISRENFREILWPLPARDMLFVGASAAEMLEKQAIRTIGDLARADRGCLAKLLGKGGDALWRYANGLDEEPVRKACEEEELKSVGNGMTFRRDIVGIDEIRAGVTALTDEVAVRLREANVKCRVVHVQIKDPAFKVISRQETLDVPTHLHKELTDAAMKIILANWKLSAPIRALTVTGSGLVKEGEAFEQLSLFACGMPGAQTLQREKLEAVESAIRKIRDRHGRGSIVMGRAENREIGIVRLGSSGGKDGGNGQEQDTTGPGGK